MQDHLPAHAMLPVQKPLHLDLAALPRFGDAGGEIPGGLGRHVEFHLSLVPGLGLRGSMGQREIDDRQAGGRMAQRIDRGFVVTIDYGHTAQDLYGPERKSGIWSGRPSR